jgi:hypothetical protein
VSPSEAVLRYVRQAFPDAAATDFGFVAAEQPGSIVIEIVLHSTTMTLEVTDDFLRDTPAQAIAQELQYRGIALWLARNPGKVVVVTFTGAYLRER